MTTTMHAEIQLKGGMRLGAAHKIEPGESYSKTDNGLCAYAPYNVVVYDLASERADEICQWSLHVRAPASYGTKTVLISDVMGTGVKSLKPKKISRDVYVETLWEALDADSNGELSLRELTDWIDNEKFVRNQSFFKLETEHVVRDMLRGMDNDKSKAISKKEFKQYFKSLDRNQLSAIGITILNNTRARVESAIAPFHALDIKKQNVIQTKHFKRWIEGKAHDERTLKIYEELKEDIEMLAKREDLTFWEWMNIVSPVDNNTTHFQTMNRMRLLCSEILGLCLSNSFLNNIAPKMNIAIMICGSRGDVQPFIPIGQKLKKAGHRVRLATHENFRDFVTKNGLEFYPIGGDPKELMAYMVKTKGQLMPGISQLMSPQYWKDTKGRLKMMEDIIMSSWDGANLPDEKGDNKPFKADVIIANPPTYAHVHLAEAMGIPLHMMFTMPWSPTSTFPHPMGNVAYKDLKESVEKSEELTTFMKLYKRTKENKMKSIWVNENVWSYKKVDLMMHVGMHALFEKFREKQGLKPKWKEGASIISEREVPFAYIWSPSLIPKPVDWGEHIDVVGFSELPGSGFTKPPPKDINDWIHKDLSKPPIFIGFGSCVLPNVRKVAETIYEAAKLADVRVIIQQGWAGLGKHLKGCEGVSFVKGAKYEDDTEAPELDLERKDFCLVIGRVAHSWLFDMVAGVCHHGGAGTTYAGLKAAKPTLIAPFFGDQPFWGQMVNNAGAGPKPTPVEQWKPKSLALKFKSMFTKEQKKAAMVLSRAFNREDGAEEAVRIFHEKLNLGKMECDLLQSDVARFWIPNWKLKLGDRALKYLRDDKPTWVHTEMGPINSYKSFDWSHNGCSSYDKELKDIDLENIVVGEKCKEIILRNLKAIWNQRTPKSPKGAEYIKVILPDPRLRL
eukprot:CAMPEP_0184489806 /NCGR_PEP_ID=MMETSP0113_2-20130426/16406_1 /TAXON_ID=91329 /ORGANISM="Norrisiella sphaerica, Strain BC52" /LENGTH=901 /DNA_ID=CAMNT_0026873429 /DNA_START=319 /DNA_END=3024 /DNA_ORIENTATION=-